MEFRHATEADLAFMAEHSVSRGCFKEQPANVDYVYALEHEGKLLGIGGIKMMTPQVAWAWVDMTAEAKQHMIVAFRLMRDYMGFLMKSHGVRRLMAAVECDFVEAVRMAEHLGFKGEFIMDEWRDGKPAYMMVRIGE